MPFPTRCRRARALRTCLRLFARPCSSTMAAATETRCAPAMVRLDFRLWGPPDPRGRSAAPRAVIAEAELAARAARSRGSARSSSLTSTTARCRPGAGRRLRARGPTPMWHALVRVQRTFRPPAARARLARRDRRRTIPWQVIGTEIPCTPRRCRIPSGPTGSGSSSASRSMATGSTCCPRCSSLLDTAGDLSVRLTRVGAAVHRGPGRRHALAADPTRRGSSCCPRS